MTTVILDPHWRQMAELFSNTAMDRLAGYDVIWGQDDPIPPVILQRALPKAHALIAATPEVTKETLASAPNLKVVIEVSGSFPETIDYAACQERGVEVLSCAPGFRSAVAEMGLAMTLAGARGLVREHEAFRSCQEHWLEDCTKTDFTLFGAQVGFVGFGQIGQELARLLAPFQPKLRAFDPWLPASVAEAHQTQLVPLEDLAGWAQVLFVAAVPTAENRGLIDAEVLRRLPDHALLVVLSRAHLIDFDAVVAEAETGRLQVALDVFPFEPLDANHAIRRLPNVILSPHRAAAVRGGRQPLGDMICDDLEAIFNGGPDRRLAQAKPEFIRSLAGIGDAARVEEMASKRK